MSYMSSRLVFVKFSLTFVTSIPIENKYESANVPVTFHS